MVGEWREREKEPDKEVCQQAGTVTEYFTPSQSAINQRACAISSPLPTVTDTAGSDQGMTFRIKNLLSRRMIRCEHWEGIM